MSSFAAHLSHLTFAKVIMRPSNLIFVRYGLLDAFTAGLVEFGR